MINNVRTVFITGGSSGIGLATVKVFFEAGWNVFFIDIDEEEGAKVLKDFGNPKSLSFYPCDIRNFDVLKEAAMACEKKYLTIDALFANAGIHHSANIENTTIDKWQNIIDINLSGTFFTVKAILPFLLRREKASIVLMGSDQSLVAKRNSFAYGATKGAIAQITKNLALDYAKNNIRVNCVCPSTIDTPLSRKVLHEYAKREFNGDLEKVLELEAQEFPLNRLGQSIEVAETVYFLTSDKASFITGTLLPIDGGYTAE